ncbi:hypothetical protein pb186bvf_012807 [Paramecium bursaria]
MRASKYLIENRDYNIITCTDFKQPVQSLPPLRKLGTAQDHPYPKKAKFEIAQEQHNSQTNNLTQDIKPTSLMNATSVKYNFIAFTQNQAAPINDLKSEQKIIHKKKGGMGEVADLGGLCYPNFNREYQEKFKENQTAFRRVKGDWPSVSDPKYTYGPFMKPFKKYKF